MTTQGSGRLRNRRRRNDTALLAPSNPRHAYIRHDDVAHMGVEQFGQRLGIGRLSDYLDVRRPLQQAYDASTNAIVIVGHDDSDLLCHFLLAYRLALPARDVHPRAMPMCHTPVRHARKPARRLVGSAPVLHAIFRDHAVLDGEAEHSASLCRPSLRMAVHFWALIVLTLRPNRAAISVTQAQRRIA